MKKALILSVICHSEMEKWNFEGIVDENLTFMDDENVYKANYNSGKLKKKREMEEENVNGNHSFLCLTIQDKQKIEFCLRDLYHQNKIYY